MTKETLCIICKGEIKPLLHPDTGEVIWEQGHNAHPIAEGRCCDSCNFGPVLKARMDRYFKHD